MQTTAHGVFRNGKVEFAQPPADVPDDTEVVVTFLKPGHVSLASLGITPDEAAAIRAGWGIAAAEDWDSPEMDAYDDYDRVKAELDRKNAQS